MRSTSVAGAPAAPWVWDLPDSRHNRADDDLRALAGELCCGETPSAALRHLADHAREMFDYGHGGEPIDLGREAVPTLCGTTRGNCVDINTFILAGALSAGLKGQYIAGYWFGPGRDETTDMHCWLAFETERGVEFWDVAHHLKWGVAGFGPGLNPAGGRRVAMSCGRGLVFETPHGSVEISHFSHPLWVLPGWHRNRCAGAHPASRGDRSMTELILKPCSDRLDPRPRHRGRLASGGNDPAGAPGARPGEGTRSAEDVARRVPRHAAVHHDCRGLDRVSQGHRCRGCDRRGIQGPREPHDRGRSARRRPCAVLFPAR